MATHGYRILINGVGLLRPRLQYTCPWRNSVIPSHGHNDNENVLVDLGELWNYDESRLMIFTNYGKVNVSCSRATAAAVVASGIIGSSRSQVLEINKTRSSCSVLVGGVELERQQTTDSIDPTHLSGTKSTRFRTNGQPRSLPPFPLSPWMFFASWCANGTHTQTNKTNVFWTGLFCIKNATCY